MIDKCLTCTNNARRGNYYCSSACCRNDSKPSATQYTSSRAVRCDDNSKPISYGYYIHNKYWSSNVQASLSNGYLFDICSSRRSPCFD